MVVGDGRYPQNKPADFSISVFGRFTDSLSAYNGHYLGNFLKWEDFLGNVCSNQTDCPQTAGHLISEKSAGLFCGCLVFEVWMPGFGVRIKFLGFLFFLCFFVTFSLFQKYNRYRPGRRSI